MMIINEIVYFAAVITIFLFSDLVPGAMIRFIAGNFVFPVAMIALFTTIVAISVYFIVKGRNGQK